MSMLKKIVLALVATLLVFVTVVAMQPAEFRIVRSATIAAPAQAVFAQVNDVHKWERWSPWAKDGDLPLHGHGQDGWQFEKGLAQMKSVVEAKPS